MEDDNYQQSLDQVDTDLHNKLSARASQYDQPNLRYTYSGMSNTSSCNEFMLNTARSFNQQSPNCSNKLNFVQAQQLFQSITKIANSLQQKMKIHNDLIIYLLYQYKWNIQKLQQVYYDKHVTKYNKMNSKIKWNGQIQNFSQFKQFRKQNQQQENKISKNDKLICQICLQQNNQLLYSFFCKHSYCKQCWQHYIEQNLIDNKIFFTCMDKECQQSPIILYFVKKIAPNLYQKYQKKICVNYSISNKAITYCPSNNCNYFCQKQITLQQNYVQCPCGMRYCFKCQKQPHQPANCNQVEEWQRLTNKQKYNQNWLEKYTKKCPQCKQNVQKYVGCNHIKCICNCQFCFNCNSIWNQQHKINPQYCIQKSNKKQYKQNKQLGKEEKLYCFLDKVIYLSRCMNKDLNKICQLQQLISDQQTLNLIKQSLEIIKTEVHRSWTNIKWSLITLYLKFNKIIQIQFQKQAIQSIHKVIQLIDKFYHKIRNSQLKSYNSMEIICLKQDLIKIKDKMIKNIQVWSQVWKNQLSISVKNK